MLSNIANIDMSVDFLNAAANQRCLGLDPLTTQITGAARILP